jgi:hypothetical protein
MFVNNLVRRSEDVTYDRSRFSSELRDKTGVLDRG